MDDEERVAEALASGLGDQLASSAMDFMESVPEDCSPEEVEERIKDWDTRLRAIILGYLPPGIPFEMELDLLDRCGRSRPLRISLTT